MKKFAFLGTLAIAGLISTSSWAQRYEYDPNYNDYKYERRYFDEAYSYGPSSRSDYGYYRPSYRYGYRDYGPPSGYDYGYYRPSYPYGYRNSAPPSYGYGYRPRYSDGYSDEKLVYRRSHRNRHYGHAPHHNRGHARGYMAPGD